MTTYMLNLLFDLSNSTEIASGLFLADDSTQSNPLLRSRVWLQSTLTNPDPNNSSNWTVFSSDSQPLSFAAALQPTLMLRVGGANMNNPTGRVTVVVARDRYSRNNNSLQTRSTPFNLGNSSRPCSVFDSVVNASGAFPAPVGGSWSFSMGAPVFNSNRPNARDSYLLLVAITVFDGSGGYTFSHDPEVEVDMRSAEPQDAVQPQAMAAGAGY
jgi:hypothetical protein